MTAWLLRFAQLLVLVLQEGGAPVLEELYLHAFFQAEDLGYALARAVQASRLKRLQVGMGSSDAMGCMVGRRC